MAYWHALCTGLVLASEMNVMHSSSLQLLCSILDESHALEQERQSSVTVSICFAEMTLWLSGICSPFNAVTGGGGHSPPSRRRARDTAKWASLRFLASVHVYLVLHEFMCMQLHDQLVPTEDNTPQSTTVLPLSRF